MKIAAPTTAAVRFMLTALKYHFILVIYQIVNKDKRCCKRFERESDRGLQCMLNIR